MPSCSICKISENNIQSRERLLTFHLLPTKHGHIVKRWIEFARLSPAVDVKNTVLCSAHFAEECILRTPLMVRLRSDAVPTLLPPVQAPRKSSSGSPVSSASMAVEETTPSREREGAASELGDTSSPPPPHSPSPPLHSPSLSPSASCSLETPRSRKRKATPSDPDPLPGPSAPSHGRRGILAEVGETRKKDLTPRKQRLYSLVVEKRKKVRNLEQRVKYLMSLRKNRGDELS